LVRATLSENKRKFRKPYETTFIEAAEAVGIRSVHFLEGQQGIKEIKKLLETV
jgi:hypothetical protein